ncbi:MAG: OmpH family outer membrane protein [Brachymonas sp.]|nr:OmpH family outer membrane protein [Brachymonas sp.]
MMLHKYLFRSAAVLALTGSALFAAPVAAQEAFATRVGFVNTDRLFSEADAAKAAQNKLKQEFSGREQQLNVQGNALKKNIEQFEKDAPKLDEAQRVARERQLMAQDADFQKKRREFQEDLENRKNEEMQRFVQKANRVVERIAQQEKYDVILQEAAYINSRIDITEKVLRALNAEK